MTGNFIVPFLFFYSSCDMVYNLNFLYVFWKKWGIFKFFDNNNIGGNNFITNLNKKADCIAVPDKVSDAEKLIAEGENIRKDSIAKIICTDPNFLGRSIKYLFSEYEELSDKEAGKLICDVTVQESNETGTVLDLDTSRKFIDVSFSIAERPIKIKIFPEPNFYKLDLNELVVRSLDYACYYYLAERKEYGSDYDKG